MPISCVVFDYGSVLAWPPSSQSCERVSSTVGMPKEALMDRYYAERAAYDRDTISDVEYWRRITRGYPAERDPTLLAKMARLDVEIWSEPNEATVGWLPVLKKAGIALALLSNMPESFCAILEERDKWLAAFDNRIFSGRVKVSKPEAAIFHLLLDKVACPPEAVLFLDDVASNVEAARIHGINAELYNVFDGGLAQIAARYGLPAPVEVRPPQSRLDDFACAPHHHLR